MTMLSAAAAQRDLLDLLDTVERGEEVVVERRGVRFRLVLDRFRGETAKTKSSPLIVKDPQLLEDDWTWKTGEDGELSFARRQAP